MEDRYHFVIDKLSKLESHSRKENLLFEGVPENQNGQSDNPETLVRKIIQNDLKVEEDLEFASVHRVGPVP